MTNQTTDASREAFEKWVKSADWDLKAPAEHELKMYFWVWQAALSAKQPMPLSEMEIMLRRVVAELEQVTELVSRFIDEPGLRNKVADEANALLAATSIKPTSEKGE